MLGGFPAIKPTVLRQCIHCIAAYTQHKHQRVH